MSDSVAVSKPGKPLLHRAPWLGLIIFLFILLEKPIVHTYMVTFLYMPMMDPEGLAWMKWVQPITGFIGMYLIWYGMKLDDVRASFMGYLGAFLVWTSWFEFYNHYFAAFQNFPMITDADGTPVLLGEHAFLQMGALYCVMFLILLGLNKDTRCRMFLWVRKKLGLKVEKPTRAYRRQYSRITAMEYLFVTWFFYIIIMTVLDPRILGATHPVTIAISVGMVIWAIWLVWWKQKEIREMGLAIRYAIPVVNVVWYTTEYTTFIGWYKEPWIAPHEWPITMTLMFVAFIALGIWIWKSIPAPREPRTKEVAAE